MAEFDAIKQQIERLKREVEELTPQKLVKKEE